MTAYYNEFDPKAAAWLRELIKRGLIADGEVDERSILDVNADDIVGYTQCHFFAGIGGWSYALRLAGISDDMKIWTGSPPCQPFSAAGQQKGKDDERHLSPHFASLVAEGRPPLLFGEQVASAAVFGKVTRKAGSQSDVTTEWAWINDLQARLEAAHYAIGVSDIPAAGVGAPQIRQRTFFGAVRLDDTTGARLEGSAGSGIQGGCERSSDARGSFWMADADCAGLQRHGRPIEQHDAQGREVTSGWSAESGEHGGMADADWSDATDGFWRDADWLFCRDGKWRPVEPSTFPLAHGIPARVVRLRGYGNAIVPQAAAAFIDSFIDAIDIT